MGSFYDILDYGAGPEPDPNGGKKVGSVEHRPWADVALNALAKHMPGHWFGLRTEDGHDIAPIKVAGHDCQILGYGAASDPFLKGVLMGSSPDIHYARDMADAMARKYIGQWFGIRDERSFFSKPQKYGVIEEKIGIVEASLQSGRK